MRQLLYATVFAAVVTAVAFSILVFARERPVVATTGGSVRGVMTLDGTALFRSVPFAKPPIGDLRWKPPMPIEQWDGERDVSGEAPACMQAPFGWNDSLAAQSSEDCLYLQIRTPHVDRKAKLPVMVWVHGGANQAGAGRGYSRSPVVKHGVVLVMAQYRLGVFGFISHPELTAESPHQASGNYALMDQIAALAWVRDNIAAFGGDPENVTLFGQSAGAQDIALLMLSPLSDGLFHRVIAQSGTASFGATPRTREDNERLGEQLVANAGVGHIKELRNLTGEDVLRATQTLTPPSMDDPSSLWLRAVVDGWVIREAPSLTLAAGRQHRVPLVIGNNSSEFPMPGGAKRAELAIKRAFGANAERAMKLYGLAPGQTASHELATQIATDITFRCPALKTAQQHAAAGLPAWHYEFGLSSDETVRHSTELPFVFYDLPVNGSGEPRITLLDYWTQFARTGDPNAVGKLSWPQFSSENASLTITKVGPAVVRDLRQDICTLMLVH